MMKYYCCCLKPILRNARALFVTCGGHKFATLSLLLLLVVCISFRSAFFRPEVKVAENKAKLMDKSWPTERQQVFGGFVFSRIGVGVSGLSVI